MHTIKDGSPDLATICRLCLQPDKGAINIFESGQLSIPVRIMACAALEVQSTDGLPKLICEKCRFQLEKSYYFRKRCQNSDGKLRKHIRLLNAGRKSRVFLKLKDDDDDEDEDELQFNESLKFIREEENKIELEEDARRLEWMKSQQEQFRKDEKVNRLKWMEEEEQNRLKWMEEEQQNRLKWMEEQKEKIRKEETHKLFEEFGLFLNSRKPIDRTVALKDENIAFEIKEVKSTKVEQLVSPTKKVKPRVKLVPRKPREPSPEPDTDNEITSSDQIPDEQEQILIYNDEGAENTDGEIPTFFLYEKNSEEGNSQIIEIESEHLDEVMEVDLNRDEEPDAAEENSMDIHVNEEEGDDEFLFTSEYADCDNRDDEDTDRLAVNIVQSYQIGENGDIQYLKDEARVDTLSISDEGDDVQNMLASPDIPHYEIEEKTEIPISAPKSKVKREASDSQQDKKQATPTPMVSVNCSKISTEDLKIFKCSECPQSFTRENSLLRHASAHKKGRQYSCDRCEKWFSCKSSLDRHTRIHTGEKPFTCHECGKSYMQKEVLKRHFAIHSGERPHPCPHCPRAFVQKLMLTQHINATHLAVPQIQKHSCHLCSKSFLHASGLSRHLITHSGMKFRCSECGRAFNDKSSIRRHLMSVHSKSKDGSAIEAPRVSPKASDSFVEYKYCLSENN